jgi:hypothetical protein
MAATMMVVRLGGHRFTPRAVAQPGNYHAARPPAITPDNSGAPEASENAQTQRQRHQKTPPNRRAVC